MVHGVKTQFLQDEAATLAFAEHFAKGISTGLIIFFEGNLGAGKTTFARGLLHGLGYRGKVKSPTYTLVEPYQIQDINLYHFDLYRFKDEEEWEAAGFREYFNDASVCLIEWPEKAASLLPVPDVTIQLQVLETGRMLTLTALTVVGEACLSALQNK
jgi:tRNA threonylcarbamoyladenosine biosynthesis protein TsaE